jgi:riboflavin kinase / FMN adenylyltransferase
MMIVARSLHELKYQRNSVVTVGTFDGVHLGHRAIIQKLTTRAQARKGRSVVITFEPHPREVVGRGPVKLLSTLHERLANLEQLHVDDAIVLEFTYEFSRQTSHDFYEQYVVKGIGVEEIIVGYDHMFGRDREAGVEELRQMGKEFGFMVLTVDAVTIDGETVNSSKIREFLLRGDVEHAERFLGHSYSLEGWVVQGDRRGTQLGFPTANIQPQVQNKLVPAEGVYCVRIDLDDRKLYGMANIGVRPTFNTNHNRSIEVYIFEFNEVIYGKMLPVHFLKRLRSEKKFSSQDELTMQLHRDRNECQSIITAIQTT